MAVVIFKVSTARPVSYYQQLFQTAGGNRQIAQRVSDFIIRVFTGSEGPLSSSVPPQIISSIQESAARASGTFTLDTVIATDAVSINGVTFTAVASGAGANQFNIGADDVATAVNLAASINASVSALVAGYVTASSALKVVTVSSAFYSTSGNQTLIASADTTIVASGARLTGGAADAGALTLNF